MTIMKGKTLMKTLHKRLGLNGLFTDFKHHSKSWRNSKKMRAKRERLIFKKWLRKERDVDE